MSKRTILFAPLNAAGHLSTSLTIADSIRDIYDYRTIFLLIGDLHDDSIKKHGHEFLILPDPNTLEDEISADEEVNDGDGTIKKRVKKKIQLSGAHKWPKMITKFGDLFGLEPLEARLSAMPVFEDIVCCDMIDSYNEFSKALESIKPDLVIADGYLLHPAILDAKIPWVKLNSANPLMLTRTKLPDGITPTSSCGYSIKTKDERERMRREEPEKWQAMLSKWKIETERLSAMFSPSAIAGRPIEKLLKGRNPIDLRISPYLNLYMFPKYLDYDQDDDILEYPPRLLRCESLMNKNLTDLNSEKNQFWSKQLASKASDNKEIIYFSMGTVASGNVAVMEKFVQIFKQDKKRLYVISKGLMGDKFKLCDDNMIGANYVPQAFFLQKVDLAIIHGGNNSITECLHFGVPMIVMPSFMDQLDNAQRIQDLKLGKRLSLEAGYDELMQAISEILADQELKDRCKKVAADMQTQNEAAKVCFLLNKIVEGESLDEKFIEFCKDKSLEEIQAAKSA